MLFKPRFKTSLQVASVAPEGVFLLSETQHFLLKGSLYQQLAPLIDGHHTVDEIVEALSTQTAAANVYYAVMCLEQQGYLVEADEYIPPALAAFYESLQLNSSKAHQRLQNAQVSIRAIGAVTTEPLQEALSALTIQAVASGGELDIILTDDYLQADLATINQHALAAHRPWLLVKPVGTMIWLGPLFQPGNTGCWACLEQRLRINRPVASFIRRRQQLTTPVLTSKAALPTTFQVGVQWVATEIVKWLLQGQSKLSGQLLTLNTWSWELQTHRLTQRPQCSACGQPALASPSPLKLASHRKTFITDGGHRGIAPESTLQQYQHHLSPITGVVRSLKPIATSGPTHIYVAQHHFAARFDDLFFLQQNLRGRSSGKGKTDVQAQVSAFGEAIERYSGSFQGNEIRHRSTYQALRETAIHPNACMHFSDQQYQNRERWNAHAYPSRQVPEPFDEEREIDWTPLWSLTEQTFKYLPTAYCYYGCSQPDCWADSNGSAAGNSREEAILQGFLELVERDSVALWWYSQIRRPQIALEGFEEPYLQVLQNYYQTLQREFWVLDITSDLNIPTFAAISRQVESPQEAIIFGFGAHFDPTIALLRAVTEMNQMLPTVITGNYLSEDPVALTWWQTATLTTQPYLQPQHVVAKVTADYVWHEDLRDDVMACVAIAKQRGLEVLVLDQTRPDVGLNVVKVVVPGLRSIWHRLAQGRLYEVPVQLGWLPQPLAEAQLNPTPVFF